MKKIFSLILLVLLPIVANAYSGEAVIDGIKYLIVTKAKIAEVRESSYSGNIVIPSTVEYDGVTCNVTSIGTAFRNCSELTSVTIPNSVTSIDSYAFSGCSNLTSITIGNSVTSIGNYAFLNCSSLTSITIPEDVSSIGDRTFEGCSSLTSIIIPNNVTSIGNYAFEFCTDLLRFAMDHNYRPEVEWKRYKTKLSSFDVRHLIWSIAIRLGLGKGKVYSNDDCACYIERRFASLCVTASGEALLHSTLRNLTVTSNSDQIHCDIQGADGLLFHIPSQLGFSC